MTVLLLLLGGAFGSVLRYVIDVAVKSRTSTSFPLGTLAVNILASAILGGLTGAAGGPAAQALIGTGLCGALSTFGTFELETVHLFQDGRYARAAANVIVTLGTGLGAFILMRALV
ncbi:fluoride efflux transporter FluC [Nonomuraea sp. NPDC050663]|uniref:fluoride efflux transporter FluC n=1 Tax=Nonomuraea sp. NPDC050663 TaxID=3364370 RepID=UPI0037A9E507